MSNVCSVDFVATVSVRLVCIASVSIHSFWRVCCGRSAAVVLIRVICIHTYGLHENNFCSTTRALNTFVFIVSFEICNSYCINGVKSDVHFTMDDSVFRSAKRFLHWGPLVAIGKMKYVQMFSVDEVMFD